ncbi:response regulator transcription factor [Actinotalea sp. AC32]|nr:response regulator transcription factor [Actinotalea sp. AC32]
MTRVLLVDDDAMMRRLLATILQKQGVDVVAQASDGDEVVRAVQAHRPDVVVMDLRMARVQGIEATAAVRRLPAPPHVLVLTSFDTRDDVLRAVEAGASGFLAKDAGPDEVLRAVEAVAAGGAALDPSATRHVLDRLAADPTRRDRDEAVRALATLTPKERDVADAVAQGMTNTAIADRLHYGETTVKTYISRALTKLDLSNRTELALLVARAGGARSS